MVGFRVRVRLGRFVVGDEAEYIENRFSHSRKGGQTGRRTVVVVEC